MVAIDIGIEESDFTANALADLGQTVTRTPRTAVTSNNTGSLTFTSGSTSTFSSIFTKRSQTFDWQKEGLFEGGDAFMQFDKDQTLNKDDHITVNGETFRVDKILIRQFAGTELFKVCNLFLMV